MQKSATQNKRTSMRVLLLDIETSPTLAWVWSLWKQNVGINQIAENGEILCWSAKWLGEDRIMFDSVHKSKPEAMLGRMHRLIGQADILVHYNGQSFDLPTLNREWLKHGFEPPAPARSVDLYQVCKKNFKFVSNKMDYVVQYLDIGAKVRHAGFELWKDCLAGDRKAWAAMEEYNRQDVALLEPLYLKLRPWITNHPSHGARDGIECCPKCGSETFQQRGYAMTSVHKYRRYQCTSCGGWFRGNRTTHPRLRAGEERFTGVAG